MTVITRALKFKNQNSGIKIVNQQNVLCLHTIQNKMLKYFCSITKWNIRAVLDVRLVSV